MNGSPVPSRSSSWSRSISSGAIVYPCSSSGYLRPRTSSARTAEGRYQVIFNRDVRGCAYFATVGGPTAAAPPGNGLISVSSLGSNVNGVDVTTENQNGVNANRPFHLLVIC